MRRAAGVSRGLVIGMLWPKKSFTNVTCEWGSAAGGSADVGGGGRGTIGGGIWKDVIGACVDVY